MPDRQPAMWMRCEWLFVEGTDETAGPVFDSLIRENTGNQDRVKNGDGQGVATVAAGQRAVVDRHRRGRRTAGAVSAAGVRRLSDRGA